MAIDTKHPQAEARQGQYTQMTDTYGGQDMVKQAGVTYLPPTEGMQLDGMNAGQPGYLAHQAYLMRAVYPDYVKQAIQTMVGIMHQEPWRIELPEKMEPLRAAATDKGESLQMLLRKVNEWQLEWGRAGLLVEVDTGVGPSSLPYIVPYGAFAIINWDEGVRAQGKQRLEFVVLDETNFERQPDFTWTRAARFRMLAMSTAKLTAQDADQSPPAASGKYQVAALKANQLVPAAQDWITPALGGVTLDEIPWTFVNTKDMTSEPDDPPLKGLSDICLAIYRAEADYRQLLYLQGQETLVVIGADTSGTNGEKTRVGAGARIDLPRQCDAKYIGVSGNGLGAMRLALEDDKLRAGEMTTKLFDSPGTSYQSGDGLRVRVSAKVATLREIALTSAEAVQRSLRQIAVWMKLNPDDVVVEANSEFIDSSAASQTALEMAQSAMMGFPISQKSMHRHAARNDMTELSFEEELAEIKSQAPLVPTDPQVQAGAAGGLGKATGGKPVKRGA